MKIRTVVILCLFIALVVLLVPANAEVYSQSTTPPKDRYYSTVINCDNWVSLREAPDTKAERIAEVPKGTVVEYCEDFGDFTYCHYENRAGYILTEYLRPSTSDEVFSWHPWPAAKEPPGVSSGSFEIVPLTARASSFMMESRGITVSDVSTDETMLYAIAMDGVPSDIDLSTYRFDAAYQFFLSEVDTAASDVMISFPAGFFMFGQESMLCMIAIMEGENTSWYLHKIELDVRNDYRMYIHNPYEIEQIQKGGVETLLITLWSSN